MIVDYDNIVAYETILRKSRKQCSHCRRVMALVRVSRICLHPDKVYFEG